MNRIAWLVAAGVLAVGSMAAAQPGFILDPWGSSAPSVKGRRAEFRVTQRAYAFPASSDVIVDPWRGALPKGKSPTASSLARGATSGTHVWPRAGEIVDPWAASARRRVSPRFDALIVDPWAR